MTLSYINESTKKVLLLLSLLPKRPMEFWDRISTIWEVQIEKTRDNIELDDTKEFKNVLAEIDSFVGVTTKEYLEELQLIEIEKTVKHSSKRLDNQNSFSTIHNADFVLARLCYAICRVLKPAVVIETGVASGVTSSYILKALEVNKHGVLHSIDMPPLGKNADQYVGKLIPTGLKVRWHLHRNTSKRILPGLLSQLKQVDIFIHDSLHTYNNMRREFETVKPYLTRPSAVIADDVDGNKAFEEWAKLSQPDYWALMPEKEKNSHCGVSLFT